MVHDPVEEGAPSSVLKYAWANEQLDVLKLAVKTFEESQPGVILPEFKPKRPGYDLRYRVAREAPYAISLLAGVIIGCFRDALDHLIYELTCYHSGVPARVDQTAWPVCEFRSQWPLRGGPKGRPNKRSGEWKIRGLPPQARALVLRYQPFYRKRTPGPHRKHPLWVLDELRNLDRHRRLTVTPVTTIGFRVVLTSRKPGIAPLRHESMRRAAKDGTVIDRIWLTPGAMEADMGVDGEMACKVALDEPTAFPGPSNLIGTLEWLSRQVDTVLAAFLPFEPPSVHEYARRQGATGAVAGRQSSAP